MSRTSLSLAGFQLIIIGRFWVTAEGQAVHDELHNLVDESKMGVSAGEDGEAVSSEKVYPASSLNDSPQLGSRLT